MVRILNSKLFKLNVAGIDECDIQNNDGWLEF